MTKEVIEKMILDETKNLSIETLNEILDFIQFIKIKKHHHLLNENFNKGVNSDLNKLNAASLLHLEDEFAHYKEEYPYES